MLTTSRLTIRAILKVFWRPISLTWLLTLIETALMTLIPLLIGYAIDGLLEQDTTSLLHLAAVMAALIIVGVIRRIYDTRAYGTINVKLGQALTNRSITMPVSILNARLDMGRELVQFLEHHVPELMDASVQLVVSIVILYVFHPTLAYAALLTAAAMVIFYSIFHQRFYRLNARLNQQKEKQVTLVGTKKLRPIQSHLLKLRDVEVKLSDTESYLYGGIFALLLGFIIFNLWYATTTLTLTAGTIFSIVSYSWEFVESSLILPATLQSWSRLTEIMERINNTDS